MAEITTAARRLCREHNSEDVVSGAIYWVNLDTGRIGGYVASYAADQPSIEWRRENRKALLRISHGRMNQREAQRYLDSLGEEKA